MIRTNFWNQVQESKPNQNTETTNFKRSIRLKILLLLALSLSAVESE